MSKLNRPITSRLSEYLLILEHLAEKRHTKISSTKLAEIFGNKASQVRQDILHINSVSNNFRQGYEIQELIIAIREALGLNKIKNIAIIGAGNLGRAIGGHVPFEKYGMKLIGLFDVLTDIYGLPDHTPIYHIDRLEEIIKEYNVSIVALCTPSVVAQGIVNRLKNTEVVSILNYSRMRLKTPDSIIVRDQQMICSFMQLCQEVENKLENN